MPPESLSLADAVRGCLSHRQVAEALGKPSPDAARMLVARAMHRLTELLGDKVPRNPDP